MQMISSAELPCMFSLSAGAAAAAAYDSNESLLCLNR